MEDHEARAGVVHAVRVKGDLVRILEKRETNVYLGGTRAEDRYGDDELAELGEWPLESCLLSHQRITRLPPLQPSVKKLTLYESPALVSLDGIERLTSLQSLALACMSQIDYERAFELLAELPELTELRLYGHAWREIPRTISRLPSLLEIQVENASSFDLAASFATLGDVATLRNVRMWLWDAVIPDALAPLRQIERLELRAKGEMFPSSVGALERLQKLVLERSEFKALPPEIGQLQRLVELDIQDNPIAALPDEICDCASLEVLLARETLLKTLPAQIGRLQKLRVLNVYSKKLKSLPPSIGDLAQLRDLSVPYSGRSKLVVPDTLYNLRLERFSGPSEILQKLTLLPPPTPEQDRVGIYNPDRIPADFGDPVELDLHLPERSEPLPQLSQLRRLKELTLDVGNLDDALRRVAGAARLRALTINGELTEIPESLGELVQIEWFMIDSGPRTLPDKSGTLRMLPDAIGKLVNLTTLSIKRNAIDTLPDAIGNLAALRSFSLQAARLVELPRTLGDLTKLQTLDIRATSALRALPESLPGCTSLERFGITGWDLAIANLPIIRELRALKVLSLAWSRGLDLPGILDALAGRPLEELNLRDTRITELPESIGKLPKLRKLELDGTNLKRFPATLRDCTELRYISMPSLYDMDQDVRDNVKAHLPPFRWKKHFRSHVTWYERSA